MKNILNTVILLISLYIFTTACSSMLTPEQNETHTEMSIPTQAPLPSPMKLTANQLAYFSLTQPWFTDLEPNFRKGDVNFQWTPQALLIQANLIDDTVYSNSDADNQHMWELGDVFEVFIQIDGHEDYFELHITPTNTRFQAHKPNVPGNDSNGEWQPIEHWLVTPISFTAEAKEIDDGWSATLEIPPSVIGLPEFKPGTKLRVAFARYDGTPGQAPSLSASAPHAPSDTVSFHIPKDWHPILFQ